MPTTNKLPCPNCNSLNVVWRPRRWYDGPLNFIETMLSGAATRRTFDGVGPMGASGVDASFHRDRQIEEQQKVMGRRTADRFWRCPDCKQHGEYTGDD
jgi:hypothetical protein